MQKNNPILINIPHSSTYIPNVEKKYFVTRNLKHEIDVMTDHFCDELFNVGNEMIRFPVSRLICDPERFRNDSEEIMSKVGMGAIYTSCSDGNVLKRIPDVHKRNLLFFYYDTYHKKLESAVD